MRFAIIKVDVLDSTKNDLEMQFVKEPALYPMTWSFCRPFSIPKTVKEFTAENIFGTSKLPERALITLLPESAYIGDPKKSCFEFAHHELRHLSLSSEGTLYPTPMGFTNMEFGDSKEGEDYLFPYLALFDNDLRSDQGSHITYEMFAKGWAIYNFDFGRFLNLNNDH